MKPPSYRQCRLDLEFFRRRLAHHAATTAADNAAAVFLASGCSRGTGNCKLETQPRGRHAAASMAEGDARLCSGLDRARGTNTGAVLYVV